VDLIVVEKQRKARRSNAWRELALRHVILQRSEHLGSGTQLTPTLHMARGR
jgi:hypothetical protein